jgi:small subunit ribosomal protein S6
MRRYETVFIVNPSLSQEESQPLFDKLTDLIVAHQGLMVKFDEWGQKRLAYEIKKQTRGYYILLDFCGNGSLVKELERNMRLDDRVLKYMTVCVAKEVDEEAIKTEIEAAEEAAKVKESSAEPVEEAEASEPQEQGPPGETPEPTPGEAEALDNAALSTEKEEEFTDGKV